MTEAEKGFRYTPTRRRFLRDSMLATAGVIAASACQAIPGIGAAKGGEFHGGWPYQLPPAGHFNTFTTNWILQGSIYADLFIPALGIYRWADAKWDYLLAESSKLDGNDFTVKLRPNLKWDDGTPFSAKDVITTYWVGRMEGFGIWNYVDTITAVDDLTVKFHYKTPTSIGERLILRNNIRPDKTFGDVAQKAKALFDAGKTTASDEVKALRADKDKLRPDHMPSVGPYKMDPASLTEASLALVRNPGGLFADKVNFDKVLVWQGETAQVTPLVLSGDIDYATHGFPVATDKQFQDQGLKIVRGPLFTGPAIYFHWNNAPQFQDKRLRQAVAHAINRNESGAIAYGESGKAPKFMAGYSDSLVPTWLSADDQKKLKEYEYSTAKADGLMKDAGYAKGSDGIYAKDGKKLEFELYYPSDFADWSSAATHATDALNKFGIKITPRGAPRAQQLTDTNDGKFQMALNAWGIGNPHPQQSLVRPIREYNTTPAGGGQKYPVTNGIDWEAKLNSAVEGFDIAKQKPIVTELTLAFNDLLPCVPLWERFNNNPVNDKKRVAGWPALTDKIYQNGGGDNFSMVLLLDGTLHKI
jgi:peptide/nickel transport system substrate-binding protein